MSAQHTKGPWEVRYRFGRLTTVVGRQRYPICDTGTAPLAETNQRREEANARLIAASPDHALICRAMCVGVARWEMWSDCRGEFCIGGIRHSTKLDEFGVPTMTVSMRAAITQATQDQGGGE
jgi:hypothetical protein